MRIIILLACLSFISFIAEGQDRWLRSAGGASQDEAFDMDKREGGGYYIGGYFNSGANFGAHQLTSSGFSDGFIQAADVSGETDWVLQLGGNGSDRVVALCAHPGGGLVATGFFSQSMSAGIFTLNATSDSLQVFITRISATGEVLWIEQAGGEYDDLPQDITVDTFGNILITGQFRGQANFGLLTAISDEYQDTPQYSYDIFLLKMSSTGVFQWLQTGKSDQDNRGMAVTTDAFNDIYLAAQISDTISFDVTHDNEVFNAGALVKFNTDGLELWFRRFSANETLPYDMKLSEDNRLRVIGDFTGLMAVYGQTLELVNPDHSRNVFLMQWQTDGSYEFTTVLGSDNALSGRALCIGEANESYITGTFRCEFTELNVTEGEGLYKSLGFGDIWLGRISETGDKNWFRHFGGPGNDFCSAIAYHSEDRAVLAGGYSGYFHVPSDDSFLDVSTPFNEIGPYPPNYSTEYCQQWPYGNWKTVKGSGSSEFSREIFFTDAVLLDQGPLDYYLRGYVTDCEYTAWGPCIQPWNGAITPLDCPDSLLDCTGGDLTIQSFTGIPGIYSPSLDYLWNIGAVEDEIPVNQSGYYEVQVARSDGCESFILGMEVDLSGNPPVPTISDELGINIEASDPESITICADSLFVWGGNICEGCSGQWEGTSDTSLVITQSGSYTFVVQDSLSCSRSNDILVNLQDTLDLVQVGVGLELMSNGQVVNMDSISICPGTALSIVVSPNPYTQPGVQSELEVDIELDGVPYTQLTSPWNGTFFPTETGLYEFTVIPVVSADNLCGDTVLNWLPLTQWVYVTLLENPELDFSYSLEGSPICPGDSALLVFSGTSTYSINGSIAEWLSPDSALLTAQGFYTMTAESVSDDGCTVSQTYSVQLLYLPSPQATTIPADGIVCPGDSVLLLAEEGDSFQWIGPLGEIIDVTQGIYVTTPGSYYCIHEDDQTCVQETNIVETFEYSSPFIELYPGTELCDLGEVQVEVISNSGAFIQWGPPLNSNQSIITLTEPGLYTVTSEVCEIETAMEVTLTLSEVEAVIEAEDIVICPGESTQLFAQEGDYSYIWQPGGETTSSIIITDPGLYTLTTFNEEGCEASSTLLISGEDMAAPIASPVTVCAGDSAMLIAQSSAPVFWSYNASGSPITGTGDTLILEDVDTALLIYAFSGDSECFSKPTPVPLNLDPSSLTPELAYEGDFCTGAELELFVQPGLSGVNYSWLLPDDSTLTGVAIYIDSLSSADQGLYQVQGLSETCISPPGEIFVNVVPPSLVGVELFPSDEVCNGDSFLVMADEDFYSDFVWTGPDTLVANSWVFQLESTGLEDAGIYSLTALDSMGCVATANVFLNVIPYPSVDLDSALHCVDGFLYATLDQGYSSYQWSNGSTDPEILIEDDGLWTVEVVNQGLCSITDSIFITDETCIDAMLNIITPNGDGENDVVDFNVMGMNLQRVEIYSRWGNLVRVLSDAYIWDGRNDAGLQVSDGVYFWIILSHEDPTHGLEKKGYLHVVH